MAQGEREREESTVRVEHWNGGSVLWVCSECNAVKVEGTTQRRCVVLLHYLCLCLSSVRPLLLSLALFQSPTHPSSFGSALQASLGSNPKVPPSGTSHSACACLWSESSQTNVARSFFCPFGFFWAVPLGVSLNSPTPSYIHTITSSPFSLSLAFSQNYERQRGQSSNVWTR